MKFSLIDEVRELVPGQSILAVKNLTRSEEYLADHFPGFPVMPGVMMLETLVQASSWLMRITSDFRYSTVLLHEAKALRFKSFVAPGDSLVVKSVVQKNEDNRWTFKAQGTVGTNEVVSARLILKQLNLGDKDPRLTANDERMVAAMKFTWKELSLVSMKVEP